MSTAKFTGVRLTDVLKMAGLSDGLADQTNMRHVRFHSRDGMMASVHIEKALNPYGDCMIAYEMNDQPLPRDHGFPLRMIVPGYAAVRSVKWLERIEIAQTEAEGSWQRGLSYKMLPPSVTDVANVDLEKMPPIMEVSVFSGITSIKIVEKYNDGEFCKVKVGGWAWAGGGRNIVRVDVTSDGGDEWVEATITHGQNQRYGRAWAWVFWQAEIDNARIHGDGTVHVASKAVDMACNVQPESVNHIWNVRGLGNNSWYRAYVQQ